MSYHSITTLNEIRAAGPCKGGWEKLLGNLGKTKADNEPLSLLTVLESNGIDDAIWCLRVPSLERLSRHFQAASVERVLHIFEAERPGDTRVREQIAMLRNDDATPEQRDAARDAASAAAGDTTSAAALAAASAAAGDTASAAASAAARAPAWTSAWDTEIKWQEGELRRLLAA